MDMMTDAPLRRRGGAGTSVVRRSRCGQTTDPHGPSGTRRIGPWTQQIEHRAAHRQSGAGAAEPATKGRIASQGEGEQEGNTQDGGGKAPITRMLGGALRLRRWVFRARFGE